MLLSSFPEACIDVVSRHVQEGEAFYSTFEQVADLGRYDYYLICSDTASHLEFLKTLNRVVLGKKILVEKPLFMTIPPEPLELQNDVFVGYNLRYHPVLERMRELLASRRPLAVNAIAGQYLPGWRPSVDHRLSYSSHKDMGGGVLLDLSHELDYLAWLFGPAKDLKAIDERISSVTVDSDDLMVCIGRTTKGVIFNLQLDYLSRIPQRRIVVHCEDCTIVADLVAATIDICDEGNGLKRMELGPVERNLTYRRMHEDILWYDGDVACTYSEASGLLRTVEMIRKSQGRG